MISATAVAPVAVHPLPQTSRAFEVAFAPARLRVGRMRRITRAFLGLWDVGNPLAENIVLAVSELVTNAVGHGEGDVALRVQYADNELRVAVTDGSPTPANLRSAGDDDDSGRGLVLIAVLAHQWGTDDDGRMTWCVFRRPREEAVMVAITRETAAAMSGQCSADDVTAGMVLLGLRRSLAHEAVTDELYDDLDAVLGDNAKPALDEVPATADRLRRSTTKLMDIVPYLVTPYPIDEMRRVIDMSVQQPPPEQARGHFIRFAIAILTLLDLMGDEAA